MEREAGPSGHLVATNSPGEASNSQCNAVKTGGIERGSHVTTWGQRGSCVGKGIVLVAYELHSRLQNLGGGIAPSAVPRGLSMAIWRSKPCGQLPSLCHAA